MLRRAQVEPIADRTGLQGDRAFEARDRFRGPAKFHQCARPVAMGVGEIRLEDERTFEARDRFLVPGQPGQCHAQKIVRARLLRVARQRALHQLDAFGEPALLASDHRQVIKRRGMSRLALQHLPIAAHGIAQRPLTVQASSLLQQVDVRSCHGMILRRFQAGWRRILPDRRSQLYTAGRRPLRGANVAEDRAGMIANSATSMFVTAQDGLKLHVRSYVPSRGPRTTVALPVVCLPGLARTGADFEELAAALAGDPDAPRRVIALDSRGSGQSDYDPNPANYSLPVELGDVLAVLTALDIGQAAFIGTSRGGILTMMLAVARPTAVAACVLNDIGPVIDLKGLVRIKSYVGKLPQPASFEDGADILRGLFGSQFPKLDHDDWMAFARRTFKSAGGRLVPDYDPRLAETFKATDLEQPLPDMWKQFDALTRAPVMVIRGGNSDILSAATVEAMRTRRASLDVLEVPDQGHAPLLAKPAASPPSSRPPMAPDQSGRASPIRRPARPRSSQAARRADGARTWW